MQRSKVAKLPPELRDELTRLWRTGEYTLDQLMGQLHAMGADVSRSGVGRYVKNVEDAMKRYREAQQVAGAWVAKLGEEPHSDVGRLLVEMLKTLAYRTIGDLSGDEALSAEPGDLMLLSRALKDLMSAEKTGVDRELKIREALKAQLEKKTEEMKRNAPADQAAAFEKARELVRGLL